MAEFKTVMSERGRMCSCLICKHCGLYFENNGHGMNCTDFMRKYLEEAEELIMQWAAEHPLVTNGAKFEEIFGVPFWAISCGVTPAISEWLRSEYKETKK